MSQGWIYLIAIGCSWGLVGLIIFSARHQGEATEGEMARQCREVVGEGHRLVLRDGRRVQVVAKAGERLDVLSPEDELLSVPLDAVDWSATLAMGEALSSG